MLVPLDGSNLSEAALGPARVLSRTIGAYLLFLRAVEQEPDVQFVWRPEPSGVTVQRAAGKELAEARVYLDALSTPVGSIDASADVLVDAGDPASAISRIARQEDVDLIAVATHGRTGLARLTMGSVATTTLQRAHVPVLLVRPPGLESPMGQPSPELREAAPPEVWPPIGTR